MKTSEKRNKILNNITFGINDIDANNDNDLKAWSAYHILYYRLNNPLYGIKKQIDNYFDDSLEFNKDICIKYFNNKLMPILDKNKEIIPRDDWDIIGLSGATEKQLFHPHFDIMLDYFKKTFNPSKKNAIIMLCSSKKPYRDGVAIGGMYKLFEEKADIFILSNPGIIPIEYDNYYPFRWYNWNEDEETKEIQKVYYKTLKGRIEDWFNYFTEYDRIVSLVRFGQTRDAFIDSNIPQEKVDMYGGEIYQEIYDEYIDVFKNKGLLHSRYLNLKKTKRMAERRLL